MLETLGHRTIAIGGVLTIWAALAAINHESILTLSALAAGGAAAVVWIWRAPQSAMLDAELKSQGKVIAAWQARLDAAEKARDDDRKECEKLREEDRNRWEAVVQREREMHAATRDALAEAGTRIRDLEARLGIHAPRTPRPQKPHHHDP